MPFIRADASESLERTAESWDTHIACSSEHFSVEQQLASVHDPHVKVGQEWQGIGEEIDRPRVPKSYETATPLVAYTKKQSRSVDSPLDRDFRKCHLSRGEVLPAELGHPHLYLGHRPPD